MEPARREMANPRGQYTSLRRAGPAFGKENIVAVHPATNNGVMVLQKLAAEI